MKKRRIFIIFLFSAIVFNGCKKPKLSSNAASNSSYCQALTHQLQALQGNAHRYQDIRRNKHLPTAEAKLLKTYRRHHCHNEPFF